MNSNFMKMYIQYLYIYITKETDGYVDRCAVFIDR